LIVHKVKVFPSKIHLPKKNQLAWKIAEIASDNAKLDKSAIEMSINRIIDNASVAVASLNRNPVISAREMAKAHLRNGGLTIKLPWRYLQVKKQMDSYHIVMDAKGRSMW
jgi:2-methylcitrate dehydratase